MKEKFTEGPWFIHPDGPKHTVNQQGTNRHIAMVSCYKAVESDDNENIANAYLIMAAPKMYELLKDVCRANLELNECCLSDCDRCPVNSVLKEARGE